MGTAQSKNDPKAISAIAKNAEDVLRQTLTSKTFVSDNAGLLVLSAQASFLIELIAAVSSTAPDPSLISQNMPKDKFLRLNNAESFQASISQVAAEICKAYRVADHSMNTIVSVLKDLPDDFISVFEILNQTHEDAKSQKSLQTLCLKIDKASKICKEKALISEKEFGEVLKTIEELCHATVVSNTTNARQLNENRMREEILNIDREAKAQAGIQFENETKVAEERQNRAEQLYQFGMQNDQTFKKMCAVGAAQVGCKIAETVGNHYAASNSERKSNGPDSPNIDEYMNTAKIGVDLIADTFQKLRIKEFDTVNYPMHNKWMQKLQTIANSLGYPMDQQTVSNHITTLKDYEAKEYGTNESVILLGKTAEVRQFLEVNGQNQENANVKAEAQKLKTSVQNTVADCTKSMEERQKQQSIERTAKLGVQEQIIKNEADKIRTASDQLNQERLKAEQIRKEKNKNAEELREIIRELRQIDLTSTDLTGYIQYLKNALRYLSKIKTSWSYLVAFFDNIKIAIDNNLTPNASLFTQQIKDDSLQSLKIRSALKATAYCFQITQCAEIYTATSKKFIMPVISNVTEQFALTMSEAKQKQSEIQYKLSCVEEEVEKSIDDYLADLDGRVNQQIETFAADLSNALESNNGLNSLQ